MVAEPTDSSCLVVNKDVTMNLETLRKGTFQTRLITKPLRQTLLLTALMSPPLLCADTGGVSPDANPAAYFSADASTTAVPSEPNLAAEGAGRVEYDDPYPSQHYTHSAWWLAGIGAATVAGMTSNYVAKDKKQHFGISMVFGAGAEFGLRQFHVADDARWGRIALATALGTVPGLIKELADSRQENNRFDKNDLLADLLGSFTGALLSDLVQGPVETGPQYSVVIGVDQVGLAVNYPF